MKNSFGPQVLPEKNSSFQFWNEKSKMFKPFNSFQRIIFKIPNVLDLLLNRGGFWMEIFANPIYQIPFFGNFFLRLYDMGLGFVSMGLEIPRNKSTSADDSGFNPFA